jgi:hypothetical protein
MVWSLEKRREKNLIMGMWIFEGHVCSRIVNIGSILYQYVRYAMVRYSSSVSSLDNTKISLCTKQCAFN